MRFALVALALVSGTFCNVRSVAERKAADSTELAARAARLEHALTNPDSAKDRSEPLARWVLPRDLAEISGLALTADARLLVHDDEIARVFEIDYRRGTKVKEFMLGDGIVHGDFEGITVARDSVYLLTSTGRLYAFQEGANGTRVGYTLQNTGLGRDCEFEGVAFDPAINSLLLACKTPLKKRLRDELVIYRWKLAGGADPVTQLTVPLDKVIGANKW